MLSVSTILPTAMGKALGTLPGFWRSHGVGGRVQSYAIQMHTLTAKTLEPKLAGCDHDVLSLSLGQGMRSLLRVVNNCMLILLQVPCQMLLIKSGMQMLDAVAATHCLIHAFIT